MSLAVKFLVLLLIACKATITERPPTSIAPVDIATLADRMYARSRELDYREPMMSTRVDNRQPMVGRGDLRREATNLYARACRSGDRRSCWRALESGSHDDVVRHEMATKVGEQCLAGDELSCLAIHRRDILDTEADSAGVRRLCERGLGSACYMLWWQAPLKTKDVDTTWLERGCEVGDTSSCAWLWRFDDDASRDDTVSWRRLQDRARAECWRGIWESCRFIPKEELETAVLASLPTLRRACRLGLFGACEIAFWYKEQHGIMGELPTLAYELDCTTTGHHCDDLAKIYKQRAPNSPDRIRDAYEHACQLDWSCQHVAAGYLKGEFLEPVAGRGMQLLEWTCGKGPSKECEDLRAVARKRHKR